MPATAAPPATVLLRVVRFFDVRAMASSSACLDVTISDDGIVRITLSG